MIVWCSWHDGYMGEKEPLEDKSITHGMCIDCESQFNKETEAYFDELDAQVDHHEDRQANG